MAAFGSSMDAQGHVLFVTVSGALILNAAVTGVSCLMIGRFRLANLLRFIPYPVSAGFVADDPCRTVVLTPAKRHWLEANRADLALNLHRHLFAERFPAATGEAQ